MLRSSILHRSTVLGLALFAGAGLGLGAVGVWSASGSDTPQVVLPAATSTAPAQAQAQAHNVPPTTLPTAPTAAPTAAPAALPLTLDGAKAVAIRFAPGRVVEVKQDTEPSGLVYDVTVLHADGTATDIEVAATGHVVSSKTDDHWDGN